MSCSCFIIINHNSETQKAKTYLKSFFSQCQNYGKYTLNSAIAQQPVFSVDFSTTVDNHNPNKTNKKYIYEGRRYYI